MADVWILATSFWPWVTGGIVALALVLLLRSLSQNRRLPYVRRHSLVTQAELKFYWSLQKAVAGDWEIFAMVRLADLLRVEKGTQKYRSWLNKILAKHIDFVLCDIATLAPVIAIELDDRSHLRPDRQQRDELVNEIFSSAEFPLIRVPVERQYDVKQLRRLIDEHLS